MINLKKSLRALRLRDNDIVADLGAGTGFYSVLLGLLVPRGKVYAVEIVKDFLGSIKSKAKENNLKNVEVIWGDVEKKDGNSIKDGTVDAVVAANVLFQLADKEQFVIEINRILKPKGRVLLTDWSKDSTIMSLKRIFPKNKAKEIFEKQGFVLEEEINVGSHHYGMILVKS